jgi:creatinine deaminase
MAEQSQGREAAALGPDDATFLDEALRMAQLSYDEGGLPIGAVLVRDGQIIGRGHNQRIQQGDPIAHGEMDCMRNAGRQTSYRDTVMYTTLSPCMMCTGTIIQFGIPRVVIGENRNFGGNEDLLSERGVEVVVADDPRCVELMARATRELGDVWNEDVGEEHED